MRWQLDRLGDIAQAAHDWWRVLDNRCGNVELELWQLLAFAKGESLPGRGMVIGGPLINRRRGQNGMRGILVVVVVEGRRTRWEGRREDIVQRCSGRVVDHSVRRIVTVARVTIIFINFFPIKLQQVVWIIVVVIFFLPLTSGIAGFSAGTPRMALNVSNFQLFQQFLKLKIYF